MNQMTVLHIRIMNIEILYLQTIWRVASHDWCGCSASEIFLAVRVEMNLLRHGLVRLLIQWNLIVGG